MRNFHLGDGQNDKSADNILIRSQKFLSKTMDPYKEYKNIRKFRSDLNLIHHEVINEMDEDDMGNADLAGGELNLTVPPLLDRDDNYNQRIDRAAAARGSKSDEQTGSLARVDNNNNQVVSSHQFTLMVKSCGEIHRLLIVANNPDGNCLFRAISQALHKSENHYNEIRCRVVEFISSAEKWPEYYPHVRGQYENLTRKLRSKNGLWSSVKKHRPKFLSSSAEKELPKEDKEATSSGGSSNSTMNNSPASNSEERFGWKEESDDFKALYSRYMTVDKCYGSLQEMLAAADMFSFNVVIVRELSDGYYNILNFLEKGHPCTFYFLFTGSTDDGHFELLLPQKFNYDQDSNNNCESFSGTDSGIKMRLKSGDYKQVGYNQQENWALIAEVEEKLGTTSLESQTRKEKAPRLEKEENKVKKKRKNSDRECRVSDELASQNPESKTDVFVKERTKTHSVVGSKTGMNTKKYVHPSPSIVLLADGAGDVNDDEDERFCLERQNVSYHNPLSRRRRWKHFFSRPLRILRNVMLCLCCPYLFTKGILTRNPSASGGASVE